MTLIAIGALTTLWFQSTLRRQAPTYEPVNSAASIRLYAFGTLLVWASVITAGRLIAYVY